MNKKDALLRLSSLENEAKELRKIIEAPEDLFTKIKNYSDVCKELNIRELCENDFSFLPYEQRKKALAHNKIQNIIKLFNQGWKENWKDSNEKKWYPWFTINASGWSFYVSCFHFSFGDGVVGFYKDEKTSNHCGKLFKDIYVDYINS